jgi:citrate synthase
MLTDDNQNEKEAHSILSHTMVIPQVLRLGKNFATECHAMAVPSYGLESLVPPL